MREVCRLLLVGALMATSSCAGASSEEAALAVELVGALHTPSQVVPAPASGLAGVDRDAGVSVELSDGSLAWFFGDSARRAPDGSIEFFQIGSAAWAPATRRSQTFDLGVGVTGPRPLAPLPALACPADAPVFGRWPLSAVRGGSPKVDRVIIWMANVCLGEGGRLVPRGIAVGEWFYSPQVVQRPVSVEVRVINPLLFEGSGFGQAAVLVGNNTAIVYRCASKEPTVAPPPVGECHSARIALSDAGDADAYKVWTGSEFRAGGRPAPLRFEGTGAASSTPPGPLSVAFDRGLQVYLMAYSPWPGAVPFGAVRVAPSPTGPWSRPDLMRLPGCEDGLTNPSKACYGFGLSPLLHEGSGLGVGYYDRDIGGVPSRGALLVGRVDVRVVRG